MTDQTPLEVACPVCQKSVQWNAQSPFRPFCSERCRLIDLGQWASEKYTIAADDQSDIPPELGDSQQQ